MGNAANYAITTTDVSARCGTKVLRLFSESGTIAQRVLQNISGLTVGKKYKASAWVRRSNNVALPCQSASLNVSKTDGSNSAGFTTGVSSEWRQISVIWTASATAARIQIQGGCPVGEELFWEDVILVLQ